MFCHLLHIGGEAIRAFATEGLHDAVSLLLL